MMFVYVREEKNDACVAPKNQSDCWCHLIGNGITDTIYVSEPNKLSFKITIKIYIFLLYHHPGGGTAF